MPSKVAFQLSFACCSASSGEKKYGVILVAERGEHPIESRRRSFCVRGRSGLRDRQSIAIDQIPDLPENFELRWTIIGQYRARHEAGERSSKEHKTHRPNQCQDNRDTFQVCFICGCMSAIPVFACFDRWM
jgi:hypothetical protein